jgi:protoporphyrinogen oxidase
MAAERIAVVGGGLLGLQLARRLAQRGRQVTVFEAADRAGGLAAPAAIGSFRWDRFYHVILLSDLHTRGLLDELGLAEHLRWGVTRTGFYTDGRMHSLSTNLEFLTFTPLSLVDKARLALTILRAASIRDGRPLEGVSVESWLRRWSGDRVYEKIWLPLLKSKLGENHRLASASFIWAIIARMYAARRAGLKREMFGYVDGGYELVLQRLQAAVQEAGVQLVTGARVEDVRDTGQGADIRLADGAVQAFDHVVLTLPTPQIARMLPQLPGAERARLDGVTYQGIVCASVLLRRPLGPYYVTNITDPGAPFTGVIEMTALVDPAQFGGHALVYLPRYLAQDDAFWLKDDAEVREEFLTALERMYPRFERADVLAFEVSRARFVLAVATLDYTARHAPPVATSLERVSVLNSAQIINGTLNVNETLAVAESGLEMLEQRLTRP